MDIVRLPLGEPAPLDADCLRIEEQAGGAWKLTSSALCRTGDEEESVSIVGGADFPTCDDAEKAGLAWATDVGVERLVICVGSLATPLRLFESDLPA